MPEIIELWGLNLKTQVETKKLRPTEREITPPLFLLCCVQLGLSMADFGLLTIGCVNDIYTESGNDEYDYRELPTKEDFDRF